MASQSLHLRPRPRPRDPQRDSNLVRASVLETALELGFAHNSAVANWIFNNPLSEEPEEAAPKPDVTRDDVEVLMPSLLSGSNSTSDETSSLNSPSNNAPSAALAPVHASHARKPSVTEAPHVHFGDFSSDQLQLFSPFDSSFHTSNRTDPSGISSGKSLKDNERSRSQDDSLRHYSTHKNPSPALPDVGYASEGQYLSVGKPSKAKDKPPKSKAKASKRPDANKTNEKEGDYLSDGGYVSASSNKSQGKSSAKVRSRAMAFFRRRPKKSTRASDDEDEDIIPPVPAIPVLPRPSSPKPLERRAAPSSPTRPGFTPLSLNLTSPPTSPPRRRISKSPPPLQPRSAPPQRLDLSAPQRSPSPLVALASAPPTVLTPAATAATFPLPPSVPSTPLSTASFSSTSAPKSFSNSSSRQHHNLPPPAPPPTLPLPQPPPSPSAQSNGALPALPTTPSRRGAPARSIPVPGPTQPLNPRRASPLRPLLSHRTLSPAATLVRNSELLNGSEGDQPSGKEATERQGSGTAIPTSLGITPAFLQRRIIYGPPPSPRRPPPDVPLPPSPYLPPSTRSRTPIGPPSKFHEHLSSVSSVPLSQIFSTPTNSMSPSLSVVALSESSSGRSLRSSHISSVSERNEELANSLHIPESSRPTTSASVVSEASCGQPISSTFSEAGPGIKTQLSYQSTASLSVYSSTMQRDSSSGSFYDDNDADVDDTASRTYVDEDEDASLYPSDDKTAGRRTMYLLEHGELDENGEELYGSRCWSDREAPPLPPLPSMPGHPGPGYF